jgi:hypothetical protein
MTNIDTENGSLHLKQRMMGLDSERVQRMPRNDLLEKRTKNHHNGVFDIISHNHDYCDFDRLIDGSADAAGAAFRRKFCGASLMVNRGLRMIFNGQGMTRFMRMEGTWMESLGHGGGFAMFIRYPGARNE